jgi:2-keto-4-pentenoate hydratase/2-oxohepta-3-ene-1,7-dioic acid hydratase in catechol pathway
MEAQKMKIVRYQVDDQARFGILEGNLIKDIRGSIFGEYEVTAVAHNVDQVTLLPPAAPSKIVCVGLNYREHVFEDGSEMPEFPSHFLKPPSAIIGPDQPIVYPRIAHQIDYEGELALVIKDRIKDVTQEEALLHVLGYTCFNDVTERILRKAPGQLTRAKGFDTFAAFGPCLETQLDPLKLTLRTFLNGRLVQEDHTGNMIFSAAYIVHYISQCMTLYPGDIISTGTPKGVGPMQPGDVVEVSIGGIGNLRNPVAAFSS